MICIEFETDSGNTYLIDVVNQKAKRIVVKGSITPDIPWAPYKELKGNGEIGQPMTLVWPDDSECVTTPVKVFRFTK